MLLLIVKLDAYLHLPGLSVGSTLFFCSLKQLLISPVTVFSLGMPEMQVSHICIMSRKQHLFCSIKTLF